MAVRRRLRGPVAAAAVLLLAGCGSPAATHGGADQLSFADFDAVVLGATESAGSVHAERVEMAHGDKTEMTGDTQFDRRGPYRAG